MPNFLSDKSRLTGLFLVLAIFILYLPLVWDHSYVWDDWLFFVNDASLQSKSTIISRVLEPVLWGSSYVRPLVLASFGLDFQFFGHDPFGSHVVNLSIHAINLVLILAIATKAQRGLQSSLLNDPGVRTDWRVWVPSVIYAIHPSLVESVAWISGRFDLLVTLFMLSALAVLIYWRDWKRDFGFATCFFLALLCKEMAITLPLIVPLFYLWITGQRSISLATLASVFSRPWWRFWSGNLAVVVLYFWLRFGVLGNLFENSNNPNAHLMLVNRIALVGETIYFYLSHTWLPFFGGSPIYPVDAYGFGVLEKVRGSLVILLSLSLVGWVLFVRFSHALVLGFVLWCVALLPVLNIIPLPIRNIGHDRFLTFPLALWALMFVRLPLSIGADRFGSRLLIPLMLSCWVFISVLLVRVSTPIWSNDLALWAWAYENQPTSMEAQNNYLVAANRFYRLDLAEKIVSAPSAVKAEEFYTNHAIYLLRSNKPAEALEVLRGREKELRSPHADHEQSDDYLKDFRAPRNQNNWIPPFYRAMAEAYYELGDYRMTERMARISLLYHPNSPVGLWYRSLGLYGMERWAEADTIFGMAVAMEPKNGDSHFEKIKRKLIQKICRMPRRTEQTEARCDGKPLVD